MPNSRLYFIQFYTQFTHNIGNRPVYLAFVQHTMFHKFQKLDFPAFIHDQSTSCGSMMHYLHFIVCIIVDLGQTAQRKHRNVQTICEFWHANIIIPTMPMFECNRSEQTQRYLWASLMCILMQLLADDVLCFRRLGLIWLLCTNTVRFTRNTLRGIR